MRGLIAFLLVGLIPVAKGQAQSPNNPDFVIEDFLNRNWSNELVSYPLSDAQEAVVKAGKALIDADGRTIPYQLGEDDGKPVIYFAANVSPLGKSAYHFAESASEERKTDLQVTETDELIEVVNAKTGIRIRKRLAGGEGPIAGIRLPDGTWFGGSEVLNISAESYQVRIVTRGPVFTEVECLMGSGKWNIRFRVQAGEPIMLVDESFNLGGQAAWEVNLSGAGFAPDRLLSRAGWSKPDRGAVRVSPIVAQPGLPFFALQPWVHWWKDAVGKWVGLFAENRSALLMVGARDAEIWVEARPMKLEELVPGLPETEKRVAGHPEIPFYQNESRTFMTLPLRQGQRNWILGAVDKADGLSPLTEKDAKGRQPLTTLVRPQEYVIKYEFPLNRVKDYVLEWADPGTHPRLYVTAETVRKMRESNVAEKVPKPTGSLNGQGIGQFIQYYFLTGDEQVGRVLANKVLADVQQTADIFLKQPRGDHSFGMAPHHAYNNFASAVNLADAVLAGNALTSDERRRLRAQLAFLGYTIAREDYWSPQRGYTNHPNMTCFVAGEQVSIGCLLDSHPLGHKWAETGLRELEQARDTWSDENGGMLETPHYSMASYDTMVGAFLVGKNSGLDVDPFHPRMKKIAEWFAKISTPPDSRLNGWRHLPPIGNTNLFELTGEFGALAGMWKDRDPEFASQLKWLHQSQGEYPTPGAGGSFPMRWGYEWVLAEQATSITPKPPSFGSELFPETTVVLRSHFPSDRETQMTLIAGWNHAHYDKDSGSFTLWGKGRIIADDFGYYSYAPAAEHNLVTGPFADDERLMKIETFVSGNAVNYVRGKKEGWTRQIAFVKDADPLGPNYFVIADSFAVPGPATWRMWTPSQSVKVEGKTALIVGKEDVDTDVVFTIPSDLKITTEEKTMENNGLMPEEKSPQKVRFGRLKFSQTAIVAEADRTQAITSVIYPRLKTDPSPVVTAIAEGKGVKIVSLAGTDYVFLAPKEFSFDANGVRFSGTSGAIRIRKEGVDLSLGAAGKIGMQTYELKADGPSEKWFTAKVTSN